MSEPEKIIPLQGQMNFPGFDPEIPITRNKGFLSAWHRGREAALEGRSLMDCPYLTRNASGEIKRNVFSIRYRKYWRDGFESIGLFPQRNAEGPCKASS